MKPEVLKSWSLEIDYSRAPCLGADQKARGLWERDCRLTLYKCVLSAFNQRSRRIRNWTIMSAVTSKRGHLVADTLLLMMFLGLRKLGNICCGHKMFLNKIRNIFVSATNVARVGKRGNICVGNNVSSFARAFKH